MARKEPWLESLAQALTGQYSAFPRRYTSTTGANSTALDFAAGVISMALTLFTDLQALLALAGMWND